MGDARSLKVTVIGAGIIGVLSALQLQREGHQVTLIDANKPGSGCSAGNAGILARSSFAPLSSPHSLLQAPGWLLKANGPLSINWRYLLRILPWLLSYFNAGLRGDLRVRGEALWQLTDQSVEMYQSLTAFANCSELIARTDYLQVYRNKKGWRKAAGDMQWRRDLGFKIDDLDAPALRLLEPALSNAYQYAHLLRDHGYVKDPQALVSALFNKFCAIGGKYVQGEVLDIGQLHHRCQVTIDSEILHSDKLVIAAGAFSAKLIKLTGVDIPLETERGYHVHCPEPQLNISRPIMDGDLKFFVTPMRSGYRFAGVVEFAGLDAPLNLRRVAALEKNARQMLPGVNTKNASYWLGFRPTLADSLPVICTAPDNPNLVYAFGHQHLGLTCAPMTAELVADLISGRTPQLDISRFAVQRLL